MLIGGPSVKSGCNDIASSIWTARRASGKGFEQVNDCRPSCARGGYHGYCVRIELWRPRSVAGQLVFTRMTTFFAKRTAPGDPRHYTFTDLHVGGAKGGGFGWGPPPAASGYYVGTHGAAPAPGCENIHSLPAHNRAAG
ncbi:MAG: hypothetical protein ACYCSI_03360 [Solirubrobacteraceae bacterium]